MKRKVIVPFEIEGSFEKSVAGVGSRSITNRVSKDLFISWFFLAIQGYRLRSGGADGSDTSFEVATQIAQKFLSRYGIDVPIEKMMRVILPWKGFNGRDSDKKECFVGDDARYQDFTKDFHANWTRLSDAEKKMMGRNAVQVLGYDLNSPASFALCYTEDGASTAEETSPKTGGTGQAIRICGSRGVKVFNLKNKEHRDLVFAWVDKVNLMWIRQCGISPKDWAIREFENYSAIPPEREIECDIVSLAEKMSNLSAIVHGANCQGKFGAGVAKALVDRWPEFKLADQEFNHDAKYKLGKLSSKPIVINGNNIDAVNLYSQQFYNRSEDVLNVDYNQLRKALIALNKKYKGKTVIMARIGYGLASGCWLTLSNLIATNLKDVDYYVCRV